MTDNIESKQEFYVLSLTKEITEDVTETFLISSDKPSEELFDMIRGSYEDDVSVDLQPLSEEQRANLEKNGFDFEQATKEAEQEMKAEVHAESSTVH